MLLLFVLFVVSVCSLKGLIGRFVRGVDDIVEGVCVCDCVPIDEVFCKAKEGTLIVNCDRAFDGVVRGTLSQL